MLRVKLKQCLDHWRSLPDAEKESPTAKHLRAACEVATKFSEKYEEERAAAVRLRLEAERRGVGE